MKSLANIIYSRFKDKGEFSLKDAYSENSDKPKETVRARIYDNLGVKFERVAKGLYKTIEGDESCVVIEGDGRDLSMLGDASIDCILTDHPWLDKKSNKGGDRNFATYDCFRYTLDDFKEKARVLKDGCFLVEILPAENENNYDYLYQIKKYAEQCGLLYYSKVTWKKGNFVSNTGRKSKNTQDVMIFSKGKARSLRIDAKKTKDTGTPQYMSGTAQMLPAMFDIPPVARKNKIHQSELPLTLCEKILQFVTRQGETVLDTFANGAQLMAALDSGEEKLPLEGEGKMLGILACDDADGNRVVLKAFSGQVGGQWVIPGWCEPAFSISEYNAILEETDQQVKALAIAGEESRGVGVDRLARFVGEFLAKRLHGGHGGDARSDQDRRREE